MNCKTCAGPCCLKGSNHEGDCEGYKPMTHYEQIKAMSVEELAEWLERIRLCCTIGLCGRSCPFAEICYSNAEEPKGMFDWLNQEAEEGET